MKSSCIYELGRVSLNQDLFFFKITSVRRSWSKMCCRSDFCFVLFCFRYEAWVGWGLSMEGLFQIKHGVKRAAKHFFFFPHLHASCKIYREITRMMRSSPLKTPHREWRLGSVILYCFIWNYLRSSVRSFLAGTCRHHRLFFLSCLTPFCINYHSQPTLSCVNRCQLLHTTLISRWGSSTSPLVITQSEELSVLLSLRGRREDSVRHNLKYQ